MPPEPAVTMLLLVAIAVFGTKALGSTRPRLDSRPRKFGMPTALVLVLLVSVAFEVLALSSIWISTVRMSPTRLARWSPRNSRAPERHRELAEAGWGRGSRADAP